MLNESYSILNDLRQPHGLYIASPYQNYKFVWVRDCVYISMPFVNKNTPFYEQCYHRLFDLFLEYEWKIDIHTKVRPIGPHEYLHARYTLTDVKEIHHDEWGHAQNDMIGAFLFGVKQGILHNKKMFRDDADKRIIQKLVLYLSCCEYWHDKDNGMWEEWREIHASSVGACVAGLSAVSDLVDVPNSLIEKGLVTLHQMYPTESETRKSDLAQLSLIYPYKLYNGDNAKFLLNRIENRLLRSRGVIRYEGDSYYSTLEKRDGRNRPLWHYHGTEAEWCFGLPWLALCHMELGNMLRASELILQTEEVMLPNGGLPEAYMANSNQYNDNTPLGWSNAMYILAKERFSNLSND